MPDVVLSPHTTISAVLVLVPLPVPGFTGGNPPFPLEPVPVLEGSDEGSGMGSSATVVPVDPPSVQDVNTTNTNAQSAVNTTPVRSALQVLLVTSSTMVSLTAFAGGFARLVFRYAIANFRIEDFYRNSARGLYAVKHRSRQVIMYVRVQTRDFRSPIVCAGISMRGGTVQDLLRPSLRLMMFNEN